MAMREFDLNIERVLENWTVAHALREVIANALDEQALTGTREPEIFQDGEGRWHTPCGIPSPASSLSEGEGPGASRPCAFPRPCA
jgi:hypothetical protein